MANNDFLTPMIKQYLQIKEQYPDAILLYRIGDFYEMFFDDAIQAAKLLEITLTSRNKNDPNPIPLCGVPHHSIEPYINKLISKGKKVAICDQVEDPKMAKVVVKREVTRVITPGIVLDGEVINSGNNNFLAAIMTMDFGKARQFGVALADVSTGYFTAAQFETWELLREEIWRRSPKEILLPAQINDKQNFISQIGQNNFNPLYTNLDNAQFSHDALEGLAGGTDLVKKAPAAAKAAGAILNYIAQTQKNKARHLKNISFASTAQFMRIDEATKRNLELFQTILDGSRKGSLLGTIDKTCTAFGARKLKEWMLYPLLDVSRINERLNAVEFIINSNLLRDLPENLAKISDIERINSRVAMGTASARDLIALKLSLELIPLIIGIIKKKSVDCSTVLISDILDKIDPLANIKAAIENIIIDEPPLTLKEGGLIKPQINQELDELKAISGGGKDAIAQIEAREKQRTGISSLKVKYNRVFGYYLEITNTHKHKVPQDYIRKQTLVNAERYITPELKEYEDKVLAAENKIKLLEYNIFCELREKVAQHSETLQQTAQALANLDVLTSFARVARDYKYCKPNLVSDGAILKIEDGRHPIIERLNPIERFVPNDLYLDNQENRLMIITGPNMAGKSTVMRQSALIVFMAQIGCFVPAKKAEIGLVDRIFTRIGASDALSLGQSTFMVEMSEASIILNQATNRSLIIIDEIGRGTSTFDGLSIAWAVAEYLHDQVKARTLFATHYHELTELALTKPGIKNFNIAVKEWNEEIIFLRKLVPGGTSHSYGIQVAKLAGLPDQVIKRSQEVLRNLEAGESDKINTSQLDLFTSARSIEILEKLQVIDTSTLTPLEALNLLHELKNKI
ncbi:MAG: DNA mismatch repair protein MutS [Pseudomonadota bacterium]